MKKLYPLLSILFFIMCSSSLNAQTAKIEYLAHASFVIESSNGTRVLIDPYHSYSQLGYTFPADVKTDFVLVTHPHFDHDGSKYFGESTPVFRKSGTFTFKDINFYGIQSNHMGAEDMAKRGQQSYNIIWVVEVDDIKIAHLGDNTSLTKEEIEKLSTIDYVIGHPEDESLGQFSSKTVYIPNHYLLPEVSKHTNWMKPIDGWLKGKNEVTRLSSNVFEIAPDKKPSRILVFQPSEKVKEWPKSYYDALEKLGNASKVFRESNNADDFLVATNEAIKLSPNTMEGYSYKAYLLSSMQKNSEIISVLEKAFIKVPDIDWGTEIRMRKMLADAYAATEQNELAYEHYVWLSNQTGITDVKTKEAAEQFIISHNSKK